MPHLKVVPTKQVILHEYFDTNRTTALKKKIITSGKWKDPPIVTQLIDGRFMVLDGANRTTSMKALGIPHMLAQVVDSEPEKVKIGAKVKKMFRKISDPEAEGAIAYGYKFKVV